MQHCCCNLHDMINKIHFCSSCHLLQPQQSLVAIVHVNLHYTCVSMNIASHGFSNFNHLNHLIFENFDFKVRMISKLSNFDIMHAVAPVSNAKLIFTPLILSATVIKESALFFLLAEATLTRLKFVLYI